MSLLKRLLFINFINFLIIVIVLGVFVMGMDNKVVKQVSAKDDDNVSGYAWSSNIGWISFNGANYGVHICEGEGDTHSGCEGGDDDKGKLVGYAWSSNIGWIKFNPAGPYPSAPDYSAKLDTETNQITGWARACAGAPDLDTCSGDGANPAAGGWDGWINLGGAAYQTSIDFTPSPAEFHGYAWGSDVVGWISFNCAEGGEDGESICSNVDYKVVTSFSEGPTVTDLNIRQTEDYCIAGPSVTVSWTFVGDSQSAYQVRIYEGDFETLVGTSDKIYLESNAYSTSSPTIKYGKTYSWEVQVWDSDGDSSGWVRDTKTVTTPPHQYPDVEVVGFTWSPQTPSVGEEVRFETEARCYHDGGPDCTWSWTIPNANYVPPSTSGSKNPVVEFTQIADDLEIKLLASDEVNTCEAKRTIDITFPLPEWREITPR